MEVYDFCRKSYQILINEITEKVPVSKSDVIKNDHMPYIPLKLFEMLLLIKYTSIPLMYHKDMEKYISLWNNFANPDEDDLTPVNERYEIYMNEASKCTKSITDKIIIDYAYMKNCHQQFTLSEYDIRKRKAFNATINCMFMEKKIKKMNQTSFQNPINTLLAAAEIVSMEDEEEYKYEEFSIKDLRKTERNAHRDIILEALDSVLTKQAYIHNQLIEYINGPHTERAHKVDIYNRRVLHQTEEKIKKYQKIFRQLTSIITESEGDVSLKSFIDKINSDIIDIKNKIDSTQGILQICNRVININVPTQLFDRMLHHILSIDDEE